jgi:acyl carrier protein
MIRRMNMLERMKELMEDTIGVDVDGITEKTSFKEDLGIDSLDLFELVMALEEEFDVEIPSESLEQMTTVGDVMKYLEDHQ